MAWRRFLVPVVGLLAWTAVVAGLTWQGLQGRSRCQTDAVLQALAVLKAGRDRLAAPAAQEGALEATALSRYLDAIRKDGLPAHAALKRRLDGIVEADTAIVTLAEQWVGSACASAGFRAATRQYADYAAAFRDRWQSTFEVFMAGGHLPAVNPIAPVAFDQALHTELGR